MRPIVQNLQMACQQQLAGSLLTSEKCEICIKSIKPLLHFKIILWWKEAKNKKMFQMNTILWRIHTGDKSTSVSAIHKTANESAKQGE